MRADPPAHRQIIARLGSWINLVERWFAELTDKRIRRSVFRSVNDLEAAIREYLDVHNQDPRPFMWTRRTDQILNSIARYARLAPKHLNLCREPSGQTREPKQYEQKRSSASKSRF